MGAYLQFPSGVLSTTTLFFDSVMDEAWDTANEISSHPVEVGSDVTDNVRVGLASCQLTVFVSNEPHVLNSFTAPALQTVTLRTPDPDVPEPPVTTLVAHEWDNKLNFAAALKGTGSLVGGALGGSLGSVVGTAIGGIASQLLAKPGPVDVPFTPDGIGQVPQTRGQAFSVQVYVQSSGDDFVTKMWDALETLRTSATLITVIGSKNFRENMVIEKVSMHRSADTGTGAEIVLSLGEIRFVTTQTVVAPAATVPRAKAVAAKGPQNPTPAPAPLNKSALRKFATGAARTGAGMLSAEQLASGGLTPADIGALL